MLCVFKSTAAGTQCIMVESNGADYHAGFYTGVNTLYFCAANGFACSGPIEPNRWHIARGVHDNAANPKTLLYIDGALQVVTANQNADGSALPLTYGKRGDDSCYLEGGIAEAAIWGTITADEIALIERDLAEYYGITLA